MTFFSLTTLLPHLQSLVPLAGKLGPPTNCFVPDNGKIHNTAKVLCHSNSVIHVDDNMPPTPWNKNGFPRMLKNLQLRKPKTLRQMMLIRINYPDYYSNL